MAIFGRKPWINPFGKMQLFDFLNFLLFWPKKAVFFFLEYRKKHFRGLYCLKKKNLEKWSFLFKSRAEPV